MLFVLFWLFASLALPLAQAQLVVGHAQALQGIIDSIVAENGNELALEPEWQGLGGDTTGVCADIFDPPPGIVCQSTTLLNTIDVDGMLSLKTAAWRPDSVDWSDLPDLQSLHINTRGGMLGSIPNVIEPFLGAIQIGSQFADNPGLTGTVPTTFFNSFRRELRLFRLPAITGPLPFLAPAAVSSISVLTIANMPALDGPIPDLRFGEFINANLRIVNTSMSGPIPESICNILPSQDYEVIDVHKNPFIVEPLPSCLTTCDPQPISPDSNAFYCNITCNNFCDLGNDENFIFDDFFVKRDGETQVRGQLTDSCAFDGSWPCTVTRDNLNCVGCDGNIGSSARYDDCGLCLLTSDPEFGQSCADCAGEPNGQAVYDVCDVCGGDGASCLDCAGVPFGDAVYDDCDVCNGGDRDKDCRGDCFGTARVDRCGVCDGCDDCVDCENEPFGSAKIDKCGVCNGANSCFPCDDDDEKDECGVCFGDNSSCLDCNGVPNGSSVLDDCNVCDGNNAAQDCTGLCGGNSFVDACDVCGGDSSSCLDCAGIANGPNVVDRCGVCGGTNACVDCAGDINGFAAYDHCDVCNGDNTSCMDCAGMPNGSAVYDRCDICNGPDTEPCPETQALALGQAAAEHTSNILVFILLALLGLCIVCSILVFVFRAGSRRPPTPAVARRREPARFTPPQQPQPPAPRPPAFPSDTVVRRGGVPVVRTAFLLAVICATLPMTSASALQGTAQWFSNFAAHTNARFIYPSWFHEDGTPHSKCEGNEEGLVCGIAETVGADLIVAVNLTRALVGEFGDVPILSFVPLADNITIVNSPNLEFVLNGVAKAGELEILRIVNVGVHGTLPDDFGHLRKLRILEIAETHLGGTLPDSMCELNSLKRLVLRHNCLECRLESRTVNNWQSLEVLDLRGNWCRGPLPDDWGVTGNSLQQLLLGNNHFEGDGIPESFLQLSALRNLDLSSNNFTGDNFFILTAVPFMPILETLCLDNNCFGPTLPDLNFYTALMELGISHNKFEGEFSIGTAFNALKVLRANNNSFTSLDPTYDDDNICGLCDFRDNLLCKNDPANVPPIYHVLQCKFDLIDNVCGTCGDLSCVDCTGVPNGSNELDQCGVCKGDGQSCIDCAGTVDGTEVYDACGVCGGNNDTCCDCTGEPGGSATYDVCDVCAGNGRSCADCAGTPYGTKEYDVCDVCDGDGSTCADCDGVIGGTSRFDECGVCNGDGSSCADPLRQDAARILETGREGDTYGQFLLAIIGSVLFTIFIGIMCCVAYFQASRQERARR